MSGNKLDFLKTPDDATRHKFNLYPASERGAKPPHPIKRLRESSADSATASEPAKRVSFIKENKLKMEILKLKEEKNKSKIEEEFQKEERKRGKLREEEQERNKHDTALIQRNTLYDRNIQLDAELNETNENFFNYKKSNDELINNLQKEVIQLEREKSELSTELKSTKVLSYQQLSKLKLENANRISDLEYSIAQSKNRETHQSTELELLKQSITDAQDDKDTLNKLRCSERELRMELDSLKNKEILATIFPNKVLRSRQLEDEHARVLRDYNNLKEDKENTDLLKIKLEDARQEVNTLKLSLTDCLRCKTENDFLKAELDGWKKAKKELNLSSPSSLVKNVGHYQKENVLLTANNEKCKASIAQLTEQLETLQQKYKESSESVGVEGDSLVKLQKKLGNTEHMLASAREECESYKKLLDSYNAAPAEDKPAMKRPCTKILHMRHNPIQEQISQEVKRLRSENSALQAKLTLSENSGVLEELEQCQAKLKEAESTMKKTKTIFRQKVNDFREGCSELFGFQITQPADKQFVLLSNYAESKDNTILFNCGANSGMELIENDYSTTMDIQTHIFKLTQHRSIPLFLADVTSDLFHRQTTVM